MRRAALAIVLLAAAWVVIPYPAIAATDGSVVVGVEIAPRAEPTELVRTGADLQPLLLALGLGAAGAGAMALSRRRAQPSAQIAAISSR